MHGRILAEFLFADNLLCTEDVLIAEYEYDRKQYQYVNQETTARIGSDFLDSKGPTANDKVKY
jgi:hypothetical protein